MATAVNEMAATVQEVARNAVDAAQATAEADQQAVQGEKLAGDAVAQIERMAMQVANTGGRWSTYAATAMPSAVCWT